jgi:hypothetical protein
MIGLLFLELNQLSQLDSLVLQQSRLSRFPFYFSVLDLNFKYYFLISERALSCSAASNSSVEAAASAAPFMLGRFEFFC